jgi:hypothetical protein
MFTLWRPIGHWPCLVWIFWWWFPHCTKRVTAPLWCTFRTAGCCLPGLVQQIVVLPGEVKSFSYSLFSLLCYCRQPLVWRCRHVDRALNACPPRCSFLPLTRSIWDRFAQWLRSGCSWTWWLVVIQRGAYVPKIIILTVTNYVEQSPFTEAIREVPRVVWCTKVRYHVQNAPPMTRLLNQMNTVHTLHHVSSRPLSVLIFSSTLLLPS